MESLRNKACHPNKGGSGVDIVLSCVDNYEARMVVNQVIMTVVLAAFFVCFNGFLLFFWLNPGRNFCYLTVFLISLICTKLVFVVVQACNEMNQTWMESGK